MREAPVSVGACAAFRPSSLNILCGSGLRHGPEGLGNAGLSFPALELRFNGRLRVPAQCAGENKLWGCVGTHFSGVRLGVPARAGTRHELRAVVPAQAL